MKGTELCSRVLSVESPWAVYDVQLDKHRQRLDVWVCQQSALGGFRLDRHRPRDEGELKASRHVNVGNFKAYIHHDQQYLGGPESFLGIKHVPFTTTMARKVLEAYSEGLSFRRICTLMDLEPEEFWQLKRAHDSGQLHLTTVKKPRPAAAAGKSVPKGSREKRPAMPTKKPVEDTGIPAANEAVWREIISGKRDDRIQALSLKLLLKRVQMQISRIDDPELQLLKINELRRYFIKNSQSLKGEITRLLA